MNRVLDTEAALALGAAWCGWAGAARCPRAAAAGPARTSAAMIDRPTAAERMFRPRHARPRRVAAGRCVDSVRYGGEMGERKASEVFVECLEAEGVRYVFGIPGE